MTDAGDRREIKIVVKEASQVEKRGFEEVRDDGSC